MDLFAVQAVAGASVGVGTLAGCLTALILKHCKGFVSKWDKAVIVWLLYNAVTHFVLVRQY